MSVARDRIRRRAVESLMSTRKSFISLLSVLVFAGCSAVDSLDFYWQGAAGQMELVQRARPISEVIEQSGDAALNARLARVRDIRAFASRDLALPDNGSYTKYTDLGRPFVLWNVFAAPALSLTPRQWCFPVAGCVNYRGYFREDDARAEATKMRAQGDDVYMSGVPAYSTLGWFDDPVLSSFVRWPDTEIARLIFHELAHQIVYVKDDTSFNESFAVAVEDAGLARWLAAQRNPALYAQAARAQRLREVFSALTRDAREKLTAVYASNRSDEDKLRAKKETFTAMKAEYEKAKAGELGLAGYDRWFAQAPNNASLAALSLYSDHVPAFRVLLEEEGNDLPRFYERVRTLAALPKSERDSVIAAAASRAQQLAGVGAVSPAH